MGARGQHRAGLDGAVAPAGCGARRGRRVRRAMPAVGRPCGGPARAARGAARRMRFRRRRSLFSARPRRGLEQSEPLKGQVWTRSEQSVREPGVHWAWRGLAAAAAIAECALLGWLWFGPALAVQTVAVDGLQHMTRAQVARAAGLGTTASVLSVDGESARQHLLSQTWVRTASVVPLLPGTVLITVSEWQPIAAYHAGKSGKLYFLSHQAIVLGLAPTERPLVDVQGPAGP